MAIETLQDHVYVSGPNHLRYRGPLAIAIVRRGLLALATPIAIVFSKVALHKNETIEPIATELKKAIAILFYVTISRIGLKAQL